MNELFRILLVEDSDIDAELISRALRKAKMKFNLRQVTSREGFMDALSDFSPDIILSDHSIPSFNAMDAFAIKQERCRQVPFILVSGSISEEFAAEGMKLGMDDYVLKGSLLRLPHAIEHALLKYRLKREKERVERLNKVLELAFQEIKEKNKEILDSITYAKRLQEAVMPGMEEVEALLENQFILYKPKSIVSGDFYFVEPIRTNEARQLIGIAVADCTGHGVSGAFMSMLGYDILKNSLTEHYVNSPSEALDYLNARISKILRASISGEKVRDGMDIAFCVLDPNTNVLYYAGAHIPCWIVRKDGSLTILKPDKQPIGYFEQASLFTQKSVQLQKGDVIYLSTDGYFDQFGGALGKKLKRRKLKELILSVYQLPMARQKQILEQTFDEWKGNLEQVDDVLLMGVKI